MWFTVDLVDQMLHEDPSFTMSFSVLGVTQPLLVLCQCLTLRERCA
jgi:hypothetical protein